ncbi:MFS transporter [Legionella sp. PATHC032]|uniref:MFS transporter n=1 Tax=Legionella sp. PATHC032 TaxID=2992039 RepID=UPI001B1F4509|nr:MFS transporter [Legionella sp. PATHC032]MCW8421765.1 MFS transporter [Legionella sp. PATHC032]HAZ7571714.1 MFS transporter [Legionella pneumophila]HBA1633654.1 MFS transporter [Legionella pneumophila]
MNTLSFKHPLLAKTYLWIIWTIAACFFFYKYLIQVSPSVMTADLMKAFQVNAAGLGNLSAFYFYSYLFMQIPVGVMLDRYSPRLLTTFAIFVCSISTYIFSQTNTLWLACLSRALMGAGAAFAAVSCFKLAAVWFSPKRFALVSGMFMTAAMLGAVGGQMPLAFLVQHEGWRKALELVSVMGIILGVVYFLVLRDKPAQTQPISNRKEPIIQLLKRIIVNRQAWALSLYSGLAFAPVSVFGGLWGVPFLEKAYLLSRTDAALAISFIFVGFAAGAPFWGWFSDFIRRRKPVLFTGTCSALLCLLIVIYSSNQNLLTLIILLFLFGFGASGFFTSFAMIRELFPLVLVATVLGIMNTFNSVFEALFEPLVGALLDWTWEGTVVDGIHQFTLHGYYFSLLLLPMSLILALLTLLLIDETYCRTKEEVE